MTEFEVTGSVKLGNREQKFDREIEANSESHAEDLIYSQLCSEHSIKRSHVVIEEIK